MWKRFLLFFALASPLLGQTPLQLARLDSLNKQLDSAQQRTAAAVANMARARALLVSLTTVPTSPPVDTSKPPVITPPDTTPTTTTPPPPSGCPNQPPGYTPINAALNDVPRWPATNSTGWVDDGRNATSRLSMITDPAVPGTGKAMSGLFPANMPGGGGPFYIYKPFTTSEQYKNIFVCMWVKHDANFSNTGKSGGNVGTKFAWLGGDQVGGTLAYWGFNSASMDFGIWQQGAVDRQMTANLNAAAAVMANKRGSWHRYEILTKANSSNSTANGEAHAWIDGVEVIRQTNVNWQMSGSRVWLYFAWNPTYGGGLSPVPFDQHESIGNLQLFGNGKP